MVSVLVYLIVIQMFMVTTNTYAIPTKTVTTTIITTSSAIFRGADVVSEPTDRMTQSVEKHSEKSETKPGLYPAFTTPRYSVTDTTTQQYMSPYKSVTDTTTQQYMSPYKSTVSQSRNMTINISQGDGSDLPEREVAELNTREYWRFPDFFRALLHGGKWPDSYTNSEQCGKVLAMFYVAWDRNETWTFRMHDSSGKRRPGLLSGTMTLSGNLEQCLNTVVTYSELNDQRPPTQVQTRFCSVFTTPPKWLSEIMQLFKVPFPVATPSLITDICTVSGCSEDDLHGVFQKYVSEHFWRENFTVTKVRCLEEKKVWEDVPAVVSLCVVFLLILLALAGTVFEIILRSRRSGVRSSMDIHIGLNFARTQTHSGCGDNKMSTSFSNNQVSGIKSVDSCAISGQTAVPETKDVCSNLDIAMPGSGLNASFDTPTYTGLDAIKEHDESQDSSSETKNVCPNLDTAVSGSDSQVSTDSSRYTDTLEERNGSQCSSSDTKNVCPNHDMAIPGSDSQVSTDSSADIYLDAPEDRDEGQDSSSETEDVCSSHDIAIHGSDVEPCVCSSGDIDFDNLEKGQGSSSGTQDVCSSVDIDMEESNSKASFDSSVATGLDATEESDESQDSYSKSKKVACAKRVKHHAQVNSSQQRTGTASCLSNMTSRSEEVAGINTEANKVPGMPTSDRASIRTVFYNGSTFRKKTLPRMKKRHLQTELSTASTGKTSVNTVTLLQRILVTFSIRRNTTNIFGKGNEDMLFCVNGLRVLSNSWIVLGSYFMTVFANPSVVENHTTISRFGQSLWAQFLINTGLAADTFFIISGALTMYKLMKVKAKSGCQSMRRVMSPAEYGGSVIHRLIRIVPCHYVALMIHVNLSGHLGTGQELRQQTDTSGHCRDHWWLNVLFISNFYKAHEMCMPWSYYLVNDLQLSLLSPLVTIPLLCRPVLGFVLIGCLVGLQVVSVLVINTPINGSSMRMNTTNYFSEVQVKPYCRAGVYAIGLGLGYFLYSGDNKVRLRKVPLCTGWLFCLTAVILLPQVTYMQYREGGRLWSGFESSIYEALSRPLWGLAVAWIIFTCCNSQGGIISKILSWNVFIPVARITYAVYVLHPILLQVVLVSIDSNIKVNFQHMILDYLALLAASWCLAICMILLVEQPFVHMETVIRHHFSNKKTS